MKWNENTSASVSLSRPELSSLTTIFFAAVEYLHVHSLNFLSWWKLAGCWAREMGGEEWNESEFNSTAPRAFILLVSDYSASEHKNLHKFPSLPHPVNGCGAYILNGLIVAGAMVMMMKRYNDRRKNQHNNTGRREWVRHSSWLCWCCRARESRAKKSPLHSQRPTNTLL